jgi:DNA-binding MarR family transcriptional regulator
MNEGKIERIAYLFVQAAEKYRRIEEMSIRMDDGTTVYGSEMHLAVAVGDGRAGTATELGELFGVTRGAVSQAVKRLEGKGILRRNASREDAKKLMIELTTKGRRLVALHARLHGSDAAAVAATAVKFGPERLAVIEEFLSDLLPLLDSCIGRQKEAMR